MRKLFKYLSSIVVLLAIAMAGVFSFGEKNYNQQFMAPLIAERVIPEEEIKLGVVLGAGLRTNGALTDLAKERVDYAMEVYEDTGLPLLFSGGDTPYGVEAVQMNAYAKTLGYEGPEHIEGSSRSTYENAFFSDELLDSAGERIDANVVLVLTSPFHSRRSLATFQQLMPERNVVIDYPSSTAILDDSFLGRWKGLRMIGREYLATEWYKIKHNISF